MNIHQSTTSYEKWVSSCIPLDRHAIVFKHKQMATGLFPFLRATFYRWMQIWREEVGDAAIAPSLLAVGDLHLENFGTWRDAEGRLIWGINDFDETYRMPYTMDLVRLATSAHAAAVEEHIAVRPRDASDQILEGYRDALKEGGRPFVLAENHRWLRKMALSRLRDATVFWQKLERMQKSPHRLPRHVESHLRKLLPDRSMPCEKKRRLAGLGSLGHTRVVLLGKWHDCYVAREAKQLTPSACVWARGKNAEGHLARYGEILDHAVRVPDPFVHPYDGWLLRRLAPDCSRIELESLPESRDEDRLLYSMGWETANIHFGAPRAIRAIKRDLAKRPANWLHKAAKAMLHATKRDWCDWVA
ncbi:MAG TPA: DUF2252 family protein [Candidatus Acidoferrales bacterium]|jgi:uncharacterized protein (DUF2252 family)|nr:DUF2252 family protein [Candidatus Acidoferrales bacterium]